MKKTLSGYFKDYNKELDQVRFIASSGSVDRDGESLLADGWVLDNFKKNPVLLWSHDAKQLPIGRVTNVYVEGNNLIADTQFAEKENPFAKQVADLVKGGFLNAVSVGFMPLEYNAGGGTIKQELLELSVVNVPANQDALRSNMYQAFVKSLGKSETKELDTDVKTPACLMDGESKDECVARKMPEIVKENPDMTQEQRIAMAENMCATACETETGPPEEESKGLKEGRTISEKNRNSMRIALDSMSQASSALNELLSATEPPEKKGGDINKQEHISKARDERIYKSVRLVDRVVEAVIHELKQGGEK